MTILSSGSIALGIFVWLPLGYFVGNTLLQNSRAAQGLPEEDIVIDLCIDPTTAADCNNHGSCIMNGTDPVCECEIGFVGDDCSNITCYHLKGNDRENDFCYMIGTEKESFIIDNEYVFNFLCSYDPSTGFQCDCYFGYFGQKCDQNICEGVDCGPNGDCVFDVDATNGTACSCHEDYGGEKCNEQPCSENYYCNQDDGGGECVSIDGVMGCRCNPPYSSESCDVNVCYGGGDYHCNGNGDCVADPATGYTSRLCDCFPGFSGDTCSSTVCDGQNCSGSGNCVVNSTDVTSYHCDCYDGYSGSDCSGRFSSITHFLKSVV